jgi:hypothetical protein
MQMRDSCGSHHLSQLTSPWNEQREVVETLARVYTRDDLYVSYGRKGQRWSHRYFASVVLKALNTRGAWTSWAHLASLASIMDVELLQPFIVVGMCLRHRPANTMKLE